MKIAIIGSGNIGGGLGRAWAKKHHEVVFGARDANEADLVKLCKDIGASAVDIAKACAGADVVVLAMPFGAIDEVLRAAGDLAGKIVIDCTNAVEWATKTLKYGHTTSAAEELQKKIPAAHVFKSFNAQGAENLANPVYGGVAASNFFCGNDAEARKKVKQLVEDVGFEAIDAGALQSARLLEPLMMLWIASSQSLGSRDIAFKVLRR
jgi:NADPH-dependent F420 reductase